MDAVGYALASGVENKLKDYFVFGSHYKKSIDGTTLTQLPVATTYLAGAHLKGKNHIFTGIGLGSTHYQFDPVTNLFTQLSNYPISAEYVEGIELNGFIYGLGGRDVTNNITYSKSCYKYDDLTNTWTQIADMPIGRRSGRAISYNNKIYYTGGNGETTLGAGTFGACVQIFEYNVSGNTWVEYMLLSASKASHVAVEKDGFIYVSHGNSNSHYKIDILTKTSSSLAGARFGSDLTYGVRTGGYIYVAFGYNGSWRSEQFLYEIHSNTWWDASSGSTGGAHVILTDGSKVYLMGGNNGSSATTRNAYAEIVKLARSVGDIKALKGYLASK